VPRAETADLEDASRTIREWLVIAHTIDRIDAKLAGLMAAHQLTHAAFSSPRPWINEGLAHFAQALYLEHETGRQAALDYIGLHRSAFSVADSEKEKQATPPRSEDEVNRSLVNTADEQLYRSKAMCVWWMLRDMVGDAALKKALASVPTRAGQRTFLSAAIDSGPDAARSGVVLRRLGLSRPRTA